MKTSRISILFSAVLLVSGCAMPTPYQPQGLTGGFAESRVSDTVYRVRFSGNGFTARDKVWYYWIHRCAELTLAKGYTGFTLEPDKPQPPKPVSQRNGDEAVIRPAASAETGGIAQGYAPAKGSGGYTYIPSYGGGTVTTYSASAFIHLLREPIPPGVSYFRAQTVVDMLKPYVASAGKSAAPAREEIVKSALVVGRRSAPGELPSSSGNASMDDFRALLPAGQ